MGGDFGRSLVSVGLCVAACGFRLALGGVVWALVGRCLRASRFYAQARWLVRLGLGWARLGGPCGGFLGGCCRALVCLGRHLGVLGRVAVVSSDQSVSFRLLSG